MVAEDPLTIEMPAVVPATSIPASSAFDDDCWIVNAISPGPFTMTSEIESPLEAWRVVPRFLWKLADVASGCGLAA
jgi:hypothetical protein